MSRSPAGPSARVIEPSGHAGRVIIEQAGQQDVIGYLLAEAGSPAATIREVVAGLVIRTHASTQRPAVEKPRMPTVRCVDEHR